MSFVVINLLRCCISLALTHSLTHKQTNSHTHSQSTDRFVADRFVFSLFLHLIFISVSSMHVTLVFHMAAAIVWLPKWIRSKNQCIEQARTILFLFGIFVQRARPMQTESVLMWEWERMCVCWVFVSEQGAFWRMENVRNVIVRDEIVEHTTLERRIKEHKLWSVRRNQVTQ